jgi:pimeloyl-ACP methyl ester carboxylesterase
MRLNAFLALIAVLAIATALWNLHGATRGVTATAVTIGDTPATVYAPASGGLHPVVVIAHGFAGSQQLMQSFALTFARNGYTAVTFDFPGHGRNPDPLTGSITDVNGATRVLVASLARVADYARGLGDGRLAVLGHSMASDIVIRYAQTTPNVTATIAVSMFSPTVTQSSPADLLVIVGDWESMLKREALRAVGLATAPAAPRAGVTYGDTSRGTGRRAAFSAHVEHVSVLYSENSMREALAWLDESFGTRRTRAPVIDGRGPWILALIAGVVLLARPLSTLLPRIAAPPVGAGRTWRELWIPLVVPMIATPLLLRVLPTHFLPVLVGDYLAVHFALYGLITLLCMVYAKPKPPHPPAAALPPPASRAAAAGAALAVIAYGFIALVLPIDTFVTSFVPGRERLILILAMLTGTLLFFLSDEWLTRGQGAARGAYAVSKCCFVVSLGVAVALDLYRLFFLIIIVPVIVLFLLIYGLFSAWIYRRTGYPLVAGIANAVAFAWAIGATFPLMAG